MQRQKLTTLDKLKYVSKGIDQKCQIHQKQTRYYCSKTDCLHYSFLCERCFRENTHGHIDQIDDYQKWTDKIIQKINELKLSHNNLFHSQFNNKNKTDFTLFLAQLRKVLGMIETLQSKLAEILLQSKLKIIGYIRKYQNNGQNRLASKFNLYTNPYILVNKINSQKNDSFVQQIKRVLRGDSAQMLDNFNPKYQFMNLQNKIKGIISGSGNQIFSLPKQIVKTPKVLQAQKSWIVCESKPDTLFSNEDTVILNVKNQTHIYNSKTQMFLERVQISISKCSSLVIQNVHNFIGISTSNNKDLLSYINKKAQNFSFQFKLYSILLYYSNGRFYAILGRDQGKLSIFDLQKKSIIATLQDTHNNKIQFLKFWKSGQKIVSTAKSSPLTFYKVIETSNEITLQFQQQLSLNLLQLQNLLIQSSYIIILTKNRNFFVYDMVLKLQFKTNYKDVCRQFDMVSLISQTDNYLMIVTHNAGESCLHLCTIQKNKPDNIFLEKMIFFNREELIFLQLKENDVWFIRPQESELKVYNFSLAIA